MSLVTPGEENGNLRELDLSRMKELVQPSAPTKSA